MKEGSTPKWREDFPTLWSRDTYVTRRDFSRFLVLVSGATVVGNSYFVARKYQEEQAPKTTKEVALVDELGEGQVKLFRYPTEDDPALLIRLTNGEFVAYKQRCTHLSCPVHYAKNTDRLECPCHNGAFDAKTGAVLSGPPPRPLPKIHLKVEEGKVFAIGADET